MDIRTVQELMGHKSITMTVRYSHLAPKHTLVAVERIANPESPTAVVNTDEMNNSRPGVSLALHRLLLPNHTCAA